MDSNRTPDLSKLSRLSRSPLTSSTGAPDLSKLSILSRNSNASDADKLARLAERSSNFGRRQPHLKDSSSPSSFSQHAGATRMYVHYTLSEDRSGSVDEVMAQRLKALSRREKEGEESPWLQCLWAGCRDSWHRDQSSLSLHVDRHVESMGKPFFCRWQGCGNKYLPFPDRFLLGDHVVMHTGQTSHTCIHCKEIFDHVEDHDTHVRIAHGSFRDGRSVSNDGAGARFGVTKLRSAEDDHDDPKKGTQDLRVLIFDEDLLDQVNLPSMFKREGIHDVTIALDAHDALAKLHTEKTSTGRLSFDIVLVEHMLLEIDARRVIKDVRRMGRELPIIALTTPAYNRDECRKAGASDFLSKPIKAEALRNLLKRYFPGAYPEVTQSSAAGF